MKTYSKLTDIEVRTASEVITPGCIALEGGALRGIYTAGVLDCLMDHDINFRTVAGVSAGAMNGANYVAGNRGRSAYIILKYRYSSSYVGMEAIRENASVIGFDFVLDGVNTDVPINEERLFSPDRTLVAAATDIQTGQTVYFSNHEGKDLFYAAIRASASMPLVCKPVVIRDRKYMDGGCSSKLPIRWALEGGFEKIVFVGTRPLSYRRKESSTESRLGKVRYLGSPTFTEALKNANHVYNEDMDLIEDLQEKGRIFTICPSKMIDVSRLEGDMEKLGSVYLLGYYDAHEKMEDLLAYLHS